MPYSKHFKHTAQSAPLLGKAMVPNAAGGYVFQVDDWQRLRRFLILGCEGGTYYESERTLTLENADTIRRCLAHNGPRTVWEIVDVSDRGRAPKNDAAVFALAVATKFGDDATRALAFQSVPKVCRIATHLFQFAEMREAIGGGWGRAMRRCIARYYSQGEDLITQAIKYQRRNGWSHRDLLRLSHPKCIDRAPLFDAICRPTQWSQVKHPLAEAWQKLQLTQDINEAAKLIADHRLTREMVPTELLKHPAVWEALLPHMPLHALVRNLGNLSKVGVLAPLSSAQQIVARRLCDSDLIHRSRLHPFAILLAQAVYARGAGVLGHGMWTPVPQVIESLDRAFHLAFHNVEATGKRYLLAVDVSSSMRWTVSHPLTPAQAAAAMALTIARTEPSYYIMGFATEFVDLGITASDTLPAVLERTDRMTFGGTDTSVAIHWAAKAQIPVDVFVVLTDNETWAGDMHTCQALAMYRHKMSIRSKLAVVAFTGTQRSIGDPSDMDSMDFIGMDASLPQALAAFAVL